MIELRWLVHGGEKVLQYREKVSDYNAFEEETTWSWSDWQDIPEVREGEG